MIFRMYRKVARIEYMDIEAKNKKEASFHVIDPKEGFTIVNSGMITDFLIDEDLSVAKINPFEEAK